MTRLVRAELLHLRSLRSTYLTALVVVALGTLVAAADASDLKTAAELREAFMSTLTLIPAIGLGLFAAARTAAEFRHGTIAHRALAAPRGRIVATKLLALCSMAVVVAAATVLGGVIATSAATDVELGLTAAMAAEIVAGVTLFAALGVAVGFLSRNQTTAVLIVFGGWVFEKLLEALTGSGVFLPYALLDGLAREEVAAGLGLAAVTAVALATATSLLIRKDVI